MKSQVGEVVWAGLCTYQHSFLPVLTSLIPHLLTQQHLDTVGLTATQQIGRRKLKFAHFCFYHNRVDKGRWRKGCWKSCALTTQGSLYICSGTSIPLLRWASRDPQAVCEVARSCLSFPANLCFPWQKWRILLGKSWWVFCDQSSTADYSRVYTGPPVFLTQENDSACSRNSGVTSMVLTTCIIP